MKSRQIWSHWIQRPAILLIDVEHDDDDDDDDDDMKTIHVMKKKKPNRSEEIRKYSRLDKNVSTTQERKNPQRIHWPKQSDQNCQNFATLGSSKVC